MLTNQFRGEEPPVFSPKNAHFFRKDGVYPETFVIEIAASGYFDVSHMATDCNTVLYRRKPSCYDSPTTIP